jgi:hypothetical protein
MFDEQDNLAIVRTELDDVFFQTLAYNATTPGIATASTGAIFKQIPNWDRQAYIYEIAKDVGLFDIIGETQNVPLDVPAVRNKVTATMKDFAKGINTLCQVTVKLSSKLCKLGGTLASKTIPNQAFAI